MEKKSLGLGKGFQGVVLSKEHSKELRRGIAEATRLREARRSEASRRSTMNISLDSGEPCAACGGAITYTSTKKFIATGEIRFGNGPAAGYYQETRTASCSVCALVYNHQHQRFAVAREKVKAERSPPGDDWLPPPRKVK